MNENRVSEQCTFFKYVNDKYVYLIAFFAGLIVLTLGSFLFMGPFAIFTNCFSGSSIEEMMQNFTTNLIKYQGFITMQTEIFALAFVIIVFKKVFIRDFYMFKNNWKRCLICILSGAILIYLSGELFEYLAVVLNIDTTSVNQEMVEAGLTGSGKWAMIIAVGLMAPLFEECVFRKFTMGYLRFTRLPVVVSTIITALIFALIHCTSEDFATMKSWFFLLNYLVLSLCLTIPYVLAKDNIYVSISIHMFNNIYSLLLVFGVINAIL